MTPSDWKHPGSTLILPAGAPRAEWLAARREGIGGSDVSAILGLTPWKSAYSVWLEKTGRAKDELEISPAMRWGLLHEPAMRKVFTEDKGLAVRRAGLHRSKRWPHLQVTPDGFTEDGGVLELKTANWRVFADDWTDEEVADHAALQVSHSMAVTGRARAHVMALTEGFKHTFYVVERDEGMIDAVAVHLENWWEEYVIGDKEPPLTHVSLPEVKSHLSITLYDQVSADDPALVRAKLDQIEILKAEAKAKENEADALEAELRVMAGEAGMLTDADDEPLFTLTNNGTFSPSKFNLLVDQEVIAKLMVPKLVLDMDAVKKNHPKEYTNCRARVFRPKKAKATK